MATLLVLALTGFCLTDTEQVQGGPGIAVVQVVQYSTTDGGYRLVSLNFGMPVNTHELASHCGTTTVLYYRYYRRLAGRRTRNNNNLNNNTASGIDTLAVRVWHTHCQCHSDTGTHWHKSNLKVKLEVCIHTQKQG